MRVPYLYWVISLVAVVVEAQQTPLNSGGGSCLSRTSGNREAVISSCCKSQTGDDSGRGSVSGTVFTYDCGRWANKYDKNALPAATPRDCAQLCVANPSCIAASWNGQKGLCYMTYQGTSYLPLQGSKWILISKTQEAAPEDPSVPNPDAVNQCDNEKDEIRRELRAQCDAETNSLRASHQEALRRAEDRCGGEKAALEQDKARCEQEKARQGSQATQQCDARTSELEGKLKQCKDSEQRLQSQGSGVGGGGGGGFAPAGATAEGCFVDRGQRALPHNELIANDMTAAKCAKHCQGYKYFGTEWSSQCFCGNDAPTASAPLSECNKACSGSKGEFCGGDWRLSVYKYGVAPGSGKGAAAPTGMSSKEPQCRNLNWYQCDAGCKEFSISGVEYVNRCMTAVGDTLQELGYQDHYATITDCLEMRCNPDPKCMGIGWIASEVSGFQSLGSMPTREKLLIKWFVSNSVYVMFIINTRLALEGMKFIIPAITLFSRKTGSLEVYHSLEETLLGFGRVLTGSVV